MTFSFVIPAYGNWAGLHQLLWDIYKNCSIPDEVIVMDDGGDLNGLPWWIEQDMLPIKLVQNKKNLGFLKNSNKGLKLATGDVACLVSTDVRIFRDITNLLYRRDALWGGRYLDWDTGWNTFDGKVYPYLEGWILGASNRTWQDLGYFDEQFSPNDMEDVDLSTKARGMGYDLMEFPNGSVLHMGAQSIPYSPERASITLQNKRKFEEKWAKKGKA